MVYIDLYKYFESSEYHCIKFIQQKPILAVGDEMARPLRCLKSNFVACVMSPNSFVLDL